MVKKYVWQPNTDNLKEKIAEKEAELNARRSVWPTFRWLPRDDISLTGHSGQLPNTWNSQPPFTPWNLGTEKPEETQWQFPWMRPPEPETPDYEELFKGEEYKEPPWWQVGLEKITYPFELLHEKVEKPGAAILTSQFTPDTPRRPGESWLEREKREYEAWEAPKFVKGTTEFAVSLPLFLIPYGGLSIAGTKFIGQAARAARLAKVGSVIEETGKIIPAVEKILAYPIAKPMSLAGKGLTKAATEEVGLQVARVGEKGLSVGFLKLKPLRQLAEEGFDVAHARRLTERWSKIPGLEWLIRKIDPSVLAYTPEARLTIAYSRQLDAAEAGVRALLMPEIMALKNPKAIFGIDDLGFARAVKPKVADAPLDMDSIIRFPSQYNLNAEQLEYIKTHNATWKSMRDALKEAGVLEHELANEVGEGGYLGRIALEFKDRETGKTINIRSGGKSVGVKQPMEKARRIENYADAVEMGFRYETDPRVVLYARLMQGFKRLVDKEFVEEVALQAGGRTIGTKALTERLARDGALQQAQNTKFVLDRLRRTMRGEKLTPQSLKAIRAKNPEVADFLENKARMEAAPLPKGAEELGIRLEGVKTEIEALKETLTTESAAKLIHLIRRTGWEKGQIGDLTLRQYSGLTGFRQPSQRMLTADKKHVRFEEALDSISTEYGYDSPYALKEAIEKAHKDMAQLARLSREKGHITEELTGMAVPEIQPTNVRASIKRLGKQFEDERRLYLKSKATAEEALRKAGPTVQEGTVFQAGMRQYMFPRETADYINKTLGSTGNEWIKTISNTNAIIRFVQTGVDLGPYFLQGLPTFVTRPAVWGKTVKQSMEGLFDERTFYAFLNQPEHKATLARLIPEGFSLNVAEFVEAAPLMSKIPAIGGFFNRWAKWFNFAIDGGRLLEAEALLALPSMKAAGDAGVRAVADHLGKKWGVMSTKWLGITEGQRQVENAVLFYSSRYTRSVIAMAKDVLRGGMQGTLARDMIGRMMLGMTMTYYGLCKAMGQEPNLDASTGKFMTIQMGTDHVGFGGSYIALVRLAGNTLRSLSENPQGLITLDSRDSPFVRFFRGRVAPTTGVAWDIISGRTFIGEPVDSFPNFGKYVALRNLTPFWLQGHAQALAGAEPMPEAGSVPAEFFGMRTWPLQPWERREDLREFYAQTEHGKPWYELKVLDRQQIEATHEDLKDITEEAWRLGIKRGRPSQVAYGQWRSEHDAVNAKYEEALWQLQEQVDRGEKTPYQFRLSAQKLGASKRFAFDRIDERPEYEDVIAALNEPRTEPEITPQFEDMAYDVYTKLMFSGDLETGVDDYDFSEAERRRRWFISTFSEETYRYVLERLTQGKDVPPLMREYYKAVEALRPYWQIQDKVEQIIGQSISLNPMAQRLVTRMRKAMRTTNPEVAHYYELFYRRTP